MVNWVLVAQIAAISVGAIAIGGGAAISGITKSSVESGVCDVVRVDDVFEDLDKSSKTEEWNLTYSVQDQWQTLYSWTEYDKFIAGDDTGIALKRYTYKMQQVCQDYDYTIGSSPDGNVGTYSYKEWCYLRYSDETLNDMMNDEIITVNPVYSTVMSPYAIGSELQFALGVGDQTLQALLPTLYNDEVYGLLLGYMIPVYLGSIFDNAITGNPAAQWNQVGRNSLLNGTTLAAYYGGIGDSANAYYSTGWEIITPVKEIYLDYLWDTTGASNCSMFTGMDTWLLVLNSSVDATTECITDMVVKAGGTGADATAAVTNVATWMGGRLQDATGAMMVGVCKLAMGADCYAPEDILSAQFLNGSWVKMISSNTMESLAELELDPALSIPFEPFTRDPGFHTEFTPSEFSGAVKFLTNTTACTFPGLGDVTGAACLTFYHAGSQARSVLGLTDPFTSYMNHNFDVGFRNDTGLHPTVESAGANRRMFTYITYHLVNAFVLEPARGYPGATDAWGLGGDIGGGILGSGLFIKRTAYELFFGWNDGLTYVLGLNPWFPGVLGPNYLTLNDWKAAHPDLQPTIITTGCKTGRQFLAYQGMSQVTTQANLPERTDCYRDVLGNCVNGGLVWAEPENITGSYVGTHFPSLGNTPDTIWIYVDQIARVAPFVHNGTKNVKGISMDHYLLDESYLGGSSPVHGQTPGLQPLGPLVGAPLYAVGEMLVFVPESQRAVFKSDSKNGSDWISPMSGADYYNRFNGGVFVDIEPNTGIVMRGRKALGGALVLNKNLELMVYSAWYFASGAINAVQTVPLFETTIFGLIGDSDASDFVAVLDAITAAVATSIGLMAGGGALLAAGGGHVFYIYIYKAGKLGKCKGAKVAPDSKYSTAEHIKQDMMV